MLETHHWLRAALCLGKQNRALKRGDDKASHVVAIEVRRQLAHPDRRREAVFEALLQLCEDLHHALANGIAVIARLECEVAEQATVACLVQADARGAPVDVI